MTTKNIFQLQKDLLAWFVVHKRDLPWRQSYLPYHVWISEIMGQQTQMERVVEYFNRWIERFPTVFSVAGAGEQEIFKAWEGLGYYRRARYIQRTAVLLTEQYHGEVPADYQQLLALPGIGPYTAAAIMSIAFNQPYPVLDANVGRVLARMMDIDRPLGAAATQRIVQKLAAELLVQNNPRDFNQAMMELGALVCLPAEPGCDQCPVRSYCRALAAGTVRMRPVSVRAQQKVKIEMACVILRHGQKIYIQQRLAEDVWGGLWEFPGGRMKEGETPEQAARRELLEETEFRVRQLYPFETVVHYYTRYKVTLYAFLAACKQQQTRPVLHAASQYRWVTLSELSEFPFPAGHRQLVSLLGKKQ